MQNGIAVSRRQLGGVPILHTSVLILAGLLALDCAQVATQLATQKALDNAVVIDSALSFDDALKGQRLPPSIKRRLRLVNVRYYSFDGRLHQGQLVIHKDLKQSIVAIFGELKDHRFPIAKVVPMSKYNYDDEASMLDNNTSAFNYRTVEGRRVLSQHALGRAIDINPFQNPIIERGGSRPRGAQYEPQAKGTIVINGLVVRAFLKRGWKWGGAWKTKKDYQHFEKP